MAGKSTMADIARRTGVSAMTVSRALGDGAVSPETRKRVREVAAEIGYVTDQTARVLSRGRSGFVGILIPTISSPHFADTLRGLTDELSWRGLQVLIGHSEYRPEREEEFLRTLLGRRPEALVLTIDGHSAGTRHLLRHAGVPIVETWDLPAEPMGHAVGYSNYEAGYALTTRMIALGFRRFGFLGEREFGNTRLGARRSGHLAALIAAGLASDRVVDEHLPPIGMLDGGAALGMLMERWPDTEIAICATDRTAFGALSECERRGWDVPGRLAITGFGNGELSRTCSPSITSVDVDGEAIGRVAAELILRDLDRPGQAHVKHDIGFTILERETTARR